MRKQPGYTIMLAITILATLAALSTVLPQASASENCLIGYKAHCPFTPVSTLLCLVSAGISCRIRSKKFKS